MEKNAYLEMYENELKHPWYQATRNMLLLFLEKKIAKNAKILDAGCGTGGTMKALKKAGFSQVQGVDNSELAIELCKRRGIDEVQLANVNKLPFKSKTFDAVICLDVLYHKGVSPKLSLNEFYRVSKSGGILYLEEPAYNWLTSRHDIAIQTRNRFTKKPLVSLVKS